MADPIDPDDPTLDQATTCRAFSTRIVNRALARLHISTPVTDLVAENSEAAAQARLELTPVLNEVLTAYPWPFATRYTVVDATALVVGSDTVPANGDWQYGYRLPADVLVVRRIVLPLRRPPRGPTRDQPFALGVPRVPFAVAADPDGKILYTDQRGVADDPLEVEYTGRPLCPAREGDAAFRSAVAWRLAAELGGPLARDAKLVTWCAQMYLAAIASAEAVGANEADPEPEPDAPWIQAQE